MAFKMAPKSPVLMKAMGYSSPAKQRSGGISSEENMEPAQERRMNKELRLIKKKKAPTPSTEVAKEETAKEVKEKVLTPKEKALQKLQEAQSDNEVSNIEKQTSKVKKNSTKKRKQAKRKESQAERRTEKTKRLEERIQRRKSRRSPAKQSTKMTPAEISKFEKNIEIQEKFDAKIEKAKGNTKKIERLTKRANRRMDRSAN
jgi:hypothetical protein